MKCIKKYAHEIIVEWSIYSFKFKLFFSYCILFVIYLFYQVFRTLKPFKYTSLKLILIQLTWRYIYQWIIAGGLRWWKRRIESSWWCRSSISMSLFICFKRLNQSYYFCQCLTHLLICLQIHLQYIFFELSFYFFFVILKCFFSP